MTPCLREFSLEDATTWIREAGTTPRSRPWLLVDADRTLAEADASRELAIRLGVNDAICATFRELGYTVEAFSRASAEFSAIPAADYEREAQRVGRRTQLRQEFLDVLKATLGHVEVTVVTAGSPTLWREVLVANDVRGVRVLGGCHRDLDPWFVGSNSKASLAQALVTLGAFVVAAGDSLVDGPMLEVATLPLVVPDSRGSTPLMEAMRHVARCRHLVVDNRRFPGMRPMHTADLIKMLVARDTATC